MKILIENYTFNATARTITITDYTSINLEWILLITNTTDNIILYNFADATYPATVLTNVITLAYDTSTMSNTDRIQIFLDIPDAIQSVSDSSVLAQLQTLNSNDATFMLRYLISVMSDPVYLNKVNNSLQTTLLTGSTTAVTGTLTAVTGLTNIGGYGADMMMSSVMQQAWNQLRNILI
jgi:hypothetical protein